jgi:hypothetical protein
MPTTTRPRFSHNWVSYAGMAIAALAFVSFVFLLLFHALGGAIHAPYAGLVIFILVPSFLILGLLLIPVGMFFEWRRWKRNKPPSIGEYPQLDLNDPQHRKMLLAFATVALIFVFLSVYGSYRAYRYTESVSFCGMLCHRVMQPEYVSHEESAHARVRCVDCHVGPGAAYFFSTKVQGVIQIYDVVTHTYPQPIPAPISALRPAREICEQCHWPAKFFGGQERAIVHFLPDKQNTAWTIALLLKVGGAGVYRPEARGIHWHVGPHTRLEYLAIDRQRQNIPWVRYTDLSTGNSTVYRAPDAPPDSKIDPSDVRIMDCMDCHDRPTHIFRSPNDLMNRLMIAGYVDPGLPDAKQTGVTLLAKKYKAKEEALAAIAGGWSAYYRTKYPDLARERQESISHSAAMIQTAYRQNFFPYMKVRWDTYLDNIGHLNSLGCYRCHDGEHKSPDGRVVGKDCRQCHAIVRQGTAEKMEYASGPEGLAFQHPTDIQGLWRMMNCSQCHSGALP